MKWLQTYSALTFLFIVISCRSVDHANENKQVNYKRGQLEERSFKDPSEIDLTNYHTTQEIFTWLKDVEAQFPSVTQLIEIGATFENRSLYVLKVGNGENPIVFVESGMHAREWVSPAVAIYFIHQFLYQYGVDEEVTYLRDNYDWHFLVLTNPDGYEYTWTTDRLWRKNRSLYASACYGVDINRNFDSAFGGEGSSTDMCASNYHGPFPFSEIESMSMRDYMGPLATNISLYLSLHSWDQTWLFAYGYTLDHCDEHPRLNELARIAAEETSYTYNNTYGYGSWAETMYVAGGNSMDWAYDTLGIKNSFVVEMRDAGEFGFELPPDQILPTSVEVWNGVKTLLFALQKSH